MRQTLQDLDRCITERHGMPLIVFHPLAWQRPMSPRQESISAQRISLISDLLCPSQDQQLHKRAERPARSASQAPQRLFSSSSLNTRSRLITGAGAFTRSHGDASINSALDCPIAHAAGTGRGLYLRKSARRDRRSSQSILVNVGPRHRRQAAPLPACGDFSLEDALGLDPCALARVGLRIALDEPRDDILDEIAITALARRRSGGFLFGFQDHCPRRPRQGYGRPIPGRL